MGESRIARRFYSRKHGKGSVSDMDRHKKGVVMLLFFEGKEVGMQEGKHLCRRHATVGASPPREIRPDPTRLRCSSTVAARFVAQLNEIM
jgi:hypothetical protein